MQVGNQEDISQNLELTQCLWAWIGGYLYLCNCEGQRLTKFTFVISKTNGSVEAGSVCSHEKLRSTVYVCNVTSEIERTKVIGCFPDN